MGKEWTRTPEQEMFLKQKLPAFPEAQKMNRVSRFFSNVFEDWFRSYPERDVLFGTDKDLDTLTSEEKDTLAEAIFQRKEQLKNYFYWHTPNRHACNDRQADMQWLVEHLIGKRSKGAPRQKKLLDVYLKLFYDTRIRHHVDKCMRDKYPEEFETRKKSDKYSSRRFAELHKIKKELYDNEEEDIHQQVEEERKRLAGLKGENEDNEQTSVQELTEMATKIKNVPAVLEKVAHAIRDETGFVTMILAGGMQHDGSLGATVLHCGNTAGENLEFRDTMLNFEEVVVGPWGRFLHRVYPPSKRKAQANLYKETYKISGTSEADEQESVHTIVWGSEGMGATEEEGGNDQKGSVPDKENSSVKVPNAEGGSSGEHSTVNTSTETEASSSAVTMSSQIYPNLFTPAPLSGSDSQGISFGTGSTQSFNPPGLTPAVADPNWIQPQPSNSGNSGLYLPSPNQGSSNTEFTSLSQEFQSVMASIDMGFTSGEEAQNSSDEHMALLQLNSMPHGGVDMSYNNAGASDKYLQLLYSSDSTNLSGLNNGNNSYLNNGYPFNFASSSDNAYASALKGYDVNFDQTWTNANKITPTFNFTAGVSDVTTNQSLHHPISPATIPSGSITPLSNVSGPSFNAPMAAPDNVSGNASNSMSSVSNGIPSTRTSSSDATANNKENQYDSPPTTPPINAPSPSVVSDPVSSSNVSERPPSVLNLNASENSDPVSNSNVGEKSGNEGSTKTNPTNRSAPFQEISTNTMRRFPTRERKRKVHRDQEFAEQQEEREVKRKRVGVEGKKQKKAN